MDTLDLTTDLTIIVSLAACLLYLLVAGVASMRRGFREQTTRLLVLYFGLSCLWELGRILAHSGRLAFPAADVLTRVTLYGTLVLALTFLHLGRSFLRLKGTGWGWWALGGVWLTALVVLGSDLFAWPEVIWLGGGWLVERRQLLFDALVFGWGIFMGGAAFLTATTYRRTHQPLHRNRITYWSLALSLSVVGAALFFAGREPLDSGFYLLGALSVAYVLLTHRLPDVRRMARGTASYLITTLLALIVYTAGFLAAYYLFRATPGYDPLSIGVALALILVILFNPLLRLVRRLVNRLIAGADYDAGSTLREYSASISNILDLERLAAAALGIIGEALGVRHGALFVVHHEEGTAEGGGYFHLRGVMGLGEGELPPAVLSDSNPVADYLCREHTPLTQYDIDLHPRFREMPPDERDWLAGLDMDVYVPIHAQGEWIGILALGSRLSGDRYFDDELLLLGTLADQTAVALENACLFDDLRARNVEIERLNEELAAANRELARLSQTKTDFIDIASHELRTPLTQVRGYTDILKEMIEEEALSHDGGERLIRGLKEATLRLEEIVDAMFDVAKIDTETLTLHLSRESVASIVEAAVDTWAAALEERRQTLTVEGLANLPRITVDRKRLEQVFSHLVQNAIKYTPDGGQIRITGHMLEWTLPRDQAIEIIVADTGIGIAHDDLERIFDKFYRVGDVLRHSTGKIKFKGAGPGLGLPIARGIVEAHGGRIWAESPGCDEETCPGGEFHVVLPVHPAQA